MVSYFISINYIVIIIGNRTWPKTIQSDVGLVEYKVLARNWIAKVVQDEHKETWVLEADPNIALWSSGQVLDSKPKTKD